MKTPLEIASEEITHLRGLLAEGLKAAEGAQVIANCYFGEHGLDPCNNDNFCRLMDWIRVVKNETKSE